MTDSLNLSELQSPSLDFDRQRFLQKWLIQSSPHMATSCPLTVEEAATNNSNTSDAEIMPSTATPTPAVTHQSLNPTKFYRKGNDSSNNHVTSSFNQLFFLMSSNGHTGAAAVNGGSARNKINGVTPKSNCVAAISSGGHHLVPLGHHIEGRKPKLRRFNSHDTSSNMFSVADFENARLARRNEIEMKQRLQRRMRSSCNGVVGFSVNGMGAAGSVGMSGGTWYGCNNGSSGLNGVGGDCSTGDSKMSKNSNDSQLEPLPADLFFDCYSMPSVVRISYKTKFCDETLQSSSSNGSSTVTSHSSASAASNTTASGVCVTPNGGSNSAGTGTGTTSSTASSSTNINPTGIAGEKNDNNPAVDSATIQGGTSNQKPQEKQGELFLLYKYINQRSIYHGHNTKTALTNRKKAVLIPQEFPGYFSLVNDKGLPTATQYTSLIQLVRERVFKFIPVDSIPAFAESQGNPAHSPPEGCFPIYNPAAAQNRPQYVRTTARSGEVYRLIAVFEDGKQDNNAMCSGGNACGTPNNNPSVFSKSVSHGREKEKGRYAQLMNDGRQIFYVSLSTKGKFYEVEPGVPIILQNMVGNDKNKKINPDCVYRISDLVTPQRELPLNLRYIAGPNVSANGIPENLNITKVTKENIFVACPIDNIEIQRPLRLRKLYVTKEMILLKTCLGFDTDKSMWSDPNVQNILKFCQFNCDLFMQTVEVETLPRSERSSSKQRGDGLKLLKPLHLPKLLRREKTTIPAHEKEDSIIFLTKTDLANLEAKENASSSRSSNRLETTTSGNRISEKMKVFQSTKKKWFRKQDKHSANSLSSLDIQVKRMSMERYTDMSKLLQERFGEKSAPPSSATKILDGPPSEPSCSDTDTTALTTITTKFKKLEKAASEEPTEKDECAVSAHTLQKSISLQDIVSQRRKQDTVQTTDSIFETSTDVSEPESCGPTQISSFITEKLYNEFHVRTRQYSKSSSSLHQLLNFSLPQKMQVNDHKRTLAQLRHNFGVKGNEKSIDFNIGAPVTGGRSAGGLSGPSAIGNNAQNISLILTPTTSSLIEDELPYSSVRDSLVLSSDDITCSEHDQVNNRNGEALQSSDYTKENIYAEICHEASAMGGIPSSNTRETITMETQSTQISSSDDYGDYASLSCPASVHNHIQQPQQTSAVGSAISRVQINCTASPVSYHTVYLGNEPLGEQYAAERQKQRKSCGNFYDSHMLQQSRDRAHVTTVELEGISHINDSADNDIVKGSGDTEGTDNIYSTLK